jgi:hypothetical protein
MSQVTRPERHPNHPSTQQTMKRRRFTRNGSMKDASPLSNLGGATLLVCSVVLCQVLLPAAAVPSVQAKRLPFATVQRIPWVSLLSTNVLHHEKTTKTTTRPSNPVRDGENGQPMKQLSDYGLPNNLVNRIVRRLRGGAIDSDVDDDDSDDDTTDESDEEDVVIPTNIPTETASAAKNKAVPPTTRDGAAAAAKTTTTTGQPVPVVIETNLFQATLLDTRLELSVLPSRSVASIKQSIRRSLNNNKPPTLILRHYGQQVDDDVLLEELLCDEMDYHDDDEEDGGGGTKRHVALQLDLAPPVDPDFLPRFLNQVDNCTTAQLLHWYATNEAVIQYHNQQLMSATSEPKVEPTDEVTSVLPTMSSSPTANILGLAQQIRLDLQNQFTPAMRARLEERTSPREQRLQRSRKQVKGHRVRYHAVDTSITGNGNGALDLTRLLDPYGTELSVGSASSSVWDAIRLALQRNLNIHWAESLRYAALFLFFGQFGGRTAVSRTLLLLGAPAVFVLQARPVKLRLRQLLYTLGTNPPSILLSLLPAPQQCILSLSEREALESIYGPFAEALAAQQPVPLSEGLAIKPSQLIDVNEEVKEKAAYGEQVYDSDDDETEDD